jgi:hypothetical protein
MTTENRIPETGTAIHNTNPYNSKVPVVGTPVYTPIPTPIGVQPHFKPRDETWPRI